MEVRVSRRDLWADQDSTEPSDNGPDAYHPDFANIEVAPIETDENQDEHLEDMDGGLQLFAGHVVAADTGEEPEQVVQERPLSYYFAQVTPQDRDRFAFAAVTGGAIIEAAKATADIANAKYAANAEDINKNWVKPHRRCRPGVQTRLKRKERNARLEKAAKDAKKEAKRLRYQAPRGRGGMRRGLSR